MTRILFFSSLDSALFDVNEHVEEHAFLSQVSSSLSLHTVGFMNRIKFTSYILTYIYINKGEQRCCYKLV